MEVLGELQAGYFITPAGTTNLVGLQIRLGKFSISLIVTLHQ